MVAESRLQPSDLIYPMFVIEGAGTREPVASLPGIDRLSIDQLVGEAGQAKALGIPAIAIFPCTPPERRCEEGKEAWNPDNLVCRAIRAVKAEHPDIGIVGDVALDPYSSHGQDGLMRDGVILNDETNVALCKQAVNQAAAGCDVIAPSDMMDGRIGAIRQALDEAGYPETLILAYSAKYASAFYGPFRDAVGSSSTLGAADKKTYQMNPCNADEALREAALDIQEGADMLMVKPGLPYLDIVYRLKSAFGLPTLAYHVSGEFAMIKAAGAQGWLDADRCMTESLSGLKRAGADAILTYAALDVARQLQG